MVHFIRHLFLLAIWSHPQPFNFFPWYSCIKNVVILVKNMTNSGWSVDQYCLLFASAVNIGLDLRPRPISLLRPIKDNIGLLTIHYLYNISNRNAWNFHRIFVCYASFHVPSLITACKLLPSFDIGVGDGFWVTYWKVKMT